MPGVDSEGRHVASLIWLNSHLVIRASSPGRNGGVAKQGWALIPFKLGLHVSVAAIQRNLMAVTLIVKDNRLSEALNEKASSKDLS